MALVDDVHIKAKAGNGGNGSMASLTVTGSPKAYADGGNGGDGGSIYFEASSNVSDLSQFRFKKVIETANGEMGLNKNQAGKRGEDVTILVPPGTKITDEKTGESIEIINLGEPVLVVQGGRGGRGSHGYKPDIKKLYEYTNEGGLGEERDLHLVLSLIADVGFIGFPNAGKSSLLERLTNATPKIGNYPFTTLEPNLGVLGKIVIADIPGLIEGASKGKGLGITFLKHIEKTKLLMHCIDSLDPDPLSTYKKVLSEFEEFNVDLLKKQEIILLTKKDLVTEEELKQKIKSLSKTKRKVLAISIYDDKSIEELIRLIKTNVTLE
ncbi:MAG TPA: GTPase ObgE [Patescibacteria group bacterium]|nr:GTPase ObgE [Patescibacteria group bacterium]